MEMKVTKVYKEPYEEAITITAQAVEGTMKAQLEIGVRITEGLKPKVTIGDTFELPLEELFDKAYQIPSLEHKPSPGVTILERDELK